MSKYQAFLGVLILATAVVVYTAHKISSLYWYVDGATVTQLDCEANCVLTGRLSRDIYGWWVISQGDERTHFNPDKVMVSMPAGVAHQSPVSTILGVATLTFVLLVGLLFFAPSLGPREDIERL